MYHVYHIKVPVIYCRKRKIITETNTDLQLEHGA
jgi:hypothetical protein